MASQRNEGEGSKSADKQYREGATHYAETADVEKVGREAKHEVESNPQELEKASKAGRAPSRGDLSSDLGRK